MAKGVAPTPESERFWRFVEITDGCWLWTGTKSNGYGRFTIMMASGRRRPTGAHRFAYKLMVGPIPAGLELDHLCFTPACVNPDHLEPIPHGLNVRRAFDRITECPQGHAYTPDNTFIVPKTGARACRECNRIRARANYAKRKAVLDA